MTSVLWKIIGSPIGDRCLCRCACGTERMVNRFSVQNGTSKSCGCLRKIANKARTKLGIHTAKGLSPNVYSVWSSMLTRCGNPNSKSYVWYGARGISVFPEWKQDYRNFHEWAMRSGYSKGLQLDRINNNGDYSPDNCRWVTPSANCKNRGPRSKSPRLNTNLGEAT